MSIHPYAYAPRPPAPYDATSVAALLLLGTVVAAPVSVVLGLLGIRATAGGRRRGRWCAVLAVVGGVLGPAVLGLGAVLLRTDPPEPKESFDGVTAGSCVDVQVADDDPYEAQVFTRSCTEPHDAEVVFRGRLDVFQAAELFDKSAAEVCHAVMAERYRTEMESGRFTMRVFLSGTPWSPEDGDPYVCLAGALDEDKLNQAIGRSA